MNTQSTELQHLKARRTELVALKDRIVAELRTVKGTLKTPNQAHVQKMAGKRQAELVTAAAEADREFVTINARIRDLNVIISNGIKPATPLEATDATSSPIRDLAHLRDEYANFSADKTRVASMRAMAAQFALELTPIIRGLINGKSPQLS